MFIVMEKSVNGNTESKVIFSEDLNVYLRDGWIKTDKKPVRKTKAVETKPVETVSAEPQQTELFEQKKENRENVYHHHGKKNRKF